MENRNGNQHEEEEVRKVPEFIYVETGREHKKGPFEGFDSAGYGQTFQQITRQQVPFFLRFFFLFLSCLVFFVLLILTPIMILIFLLNAICLFKAEPLWERTKLVWNNFKTLLVAGLGLFISVFSPAFGFAVIMVYAMISGGKLDENWMARIIKHRMPPR